ncbi:MAG: response regulator, partial [Quisquiliibacterium sp.]
FGALGITARYAMNGDDALMQTALGRFQPELAMIDYGLPGRFDGITLIGMLRPRFPNCKFLLVTGDTNPEVLKRASSEQVPVLHKPITIARLADKLKEIGLA